MVERIRYRERNVGIPQQRTQFRRILEGGIESRQEDFSVNSMADSYDRRVLASGEKEQREYFAIHRIYNWLNFTFGELDREQSSQEFSTYLSDIWGGIEKTMKPREERGETAKTILQMERREKQLHQKHGPHSLEFASERNLQIRADMLGTRIAINLAKQIVGELEGKSAKRFKRK